MERSEDIMVHQHARRPSCVSIEDVVDLPPSVNSVTVQ